jgi:uncharacterized repeat protein (TIGR01451 family)
MSTHPLGMRRLRVVLALSAALAAGGAWAAVVPAPTDNSYTAPNTNVSNIATVSYEVANTPQPDIESSPTGNSTPGGGNGTDTEFVVDELVDILVTERNGEETEVAPNQNATATAPVVGFWITNRSNVTIDIDYAIANLPDTTASPFGNDPDSFNPGAYTIYIDDGDLTFNAADETVDADGILDAVAPDTDILIWVRTASIGAEDDEETAVVSLTAEAFINDGIADSLGAAFVNDEAAANGALTVETVFGDVAGSDDAVEDAIHSARSEFRVVSVELTVAKAQSILTDIWGSAVPKWLPGNTVRYTISVAAAGSGSAQNVVITDVLDTANLDDSTLIVRVDSDDDGCGDDAPADLGEGVDTDGAEFSAGTLTLTVANMGGGSVGPTLQDSETAYFCVDIEIR